MQSFRHVASREKSYGIFLSKFLFLKNGTRDFQNSPPFKRSTCFYETATESFERFQYLSFETDFLENKMLFQKTGVPFFS